MKLKIKSTSFWKEIMKSQRWTMLVSSLLMLVFFPIELMMNTQSYERHLTRAELLGRVNGYFMFYDTYSDINRFTSIGYGILYVSLILGAIAGVMAFAYLHNSSQVGLFHSLPISRGKLANIKFQTATTGYLASILLGNIVLVITLVTRGWLTQEFIVKLLLFIMYNLLFYWMGYLVSAIAMLLTGKVFIGVFGAIAISSYVPVVAVLIASLIETYFDTFYYNYNTVISSMEWGIRISPVTYVRMVEPNSFKYAVLTLFIVCVLWMIHKWLIKMRPSEAAGKAMAYRRVGEVIKIALVTAFAIGVALIFYGSAYYSMEWMYLGLVFGIVVGYIIIQLLYGIEFRELFKQKLQFLMITVFSFAVVTVFAYDLIGYDTYLPAYDDIQDINIEFSDVSLYSTNVREIGLHESHMGKNQETYALVESMIHSAELVSKEGYVDGAGRVSVYVGYRLNNGRLVQREYNVALEDVRDKLGCLWTNEEFLDAMYPIRWLDLENIKDVTIDESYTTGLNYEFELTTEEKRAFLEAYKLDAMEITAEIVEKERPIINMNYYYTAPDTGVWHGFDLFIYPSFSHTLEFFESLDSVGFEVCTSIKNEDITINEMGEGSARLISNPREIEELLPQLVSSSLIDNFMEVDYETSYEIEMYGHFDSYYKLKSEE